jgi:hypothetical protein
MSVAIALSALAFAYMLCLTPRRGKVKFWRYKVA